MNTPPPVPIEVRIDAQVRASLAEHIGEDATAALGVNEAAMRLALLAPARYLSLHRQGEAAAHSEAVAARYAVPVPTEEEARAARKFADDCDLARRDYPAYLKQRNTETEARLAAQRKEGRK